MTSSEARARQALSQIIADGHDKNACRIIAAAIRAAEEAEREAALDELAARRETHKAEEARLLCEANPLKAGCHKVAAEALQEALVAIRARSTT